MDGWYWNSDEKICKACTTVDPYCKTCKFIDASKKPICDTCVEFDSNNSNVGGDKLRKYYIKNSESLCKACPDYCFACK